MNDAIKNHWSRIMALSCYVCESPAEIHHCFGGSMTLRGVYKPLSGKTSDYLCIGLCPTHHRHQEGIHTLGTSRWERMFGQQAIMLDRISATLNVDVWKLSGEKHVKIYRRPEKVLPRIVA